MTDRYVALQQRQRTIEILFQKIEVRTKIFFFIENSNCFQMLRERLRRKEELLEDYEKDLARLRQAELLLREKDILIEDLQVNSSSFCCFDLFDRFFLQTDKRTKDDETLFLRNTLKETQSHLNQEKRVNSAIKFGRVSRKRNFQNQTKFFFVFSKPNPTESRSNSSERIDSTKWRFNNNVTSSLSTGFEFEVSNCSTRF